MEQVIESLASGLGNGVAWLAENGVLFGIFAIIWIAFAAGLIWSQGSLDQGMDRHSRPAADRADLRLGVVPSRDDRVVDLGNELAADRSARARRRCRRLEPADVPAQGVAGRTAIAGSEIDMHGRYVPALVVLGGLAAAVYAFVIRLRMLGWGSTVEERTRPLPGDDIEPDAEYVTTRATTTRRPLRPSGSG